MRNLIFICTCLIFVIPAQARTITVDDDGPADFNNIQAAIDDANNGDTIIVADGTYTGEGNRDIDFFGKAVTVQSESGPENCIIDCESSGRGFYFHSGEGPNSVLAGFTITNGYASGSWPKCNGGGILCEEAGPILSNCIIKDNQAERHGGGIGCRGSSAKIAGCTVSGNIALKLGGGIYSVGAVGGDTITNCIITGNSIEDKWGRGAGIYGNPTITNCTISKNSGVGIDSGHNTINNCIISANESTGISNRYCNPTITNCTITRNAGGGFYSYEGAPIISNCVITDNVGNTGGGIKCYGGTATISNCVISGNLARFYGGGIGCDGGRSTITNCTIAGNKAHHRGGGISSDGHSRLSVTDCIIWSNYAPDGPEVYLERDSIAEIKYTNVQGGQVNSYLEPGAILNWGHGNIDADPCFVDPGFWGDANDPNAIWVEGDYHLLAGSPCVDAGDPNYVAGPNETDLDGNPRVIGGRIDMGAYEYWPPVQTEMKLTPQSLNCASRGKYIKAHITLPEGFLAEDVDVNEPALAEPVDVESEYIKIPGNGDSPVKVEIGFDRQEFCDCVAEAGVIEVTVSGYLTTGQLFIATDTVKIGNRGGRR